MSQTASFENPMNFERLEDFPNYSSCIRFFGKPILPPLVTAERRDAICILRTSAAKKENEILKRRESYSHHSRKVKEIYHMVAEHLSSSSISSGFIPASGNTQFNVSALPSYSVYELFPSPCADTRSFESSMHVSMTKIPSSDICSTVHTGVIVCPDVYSRRHENLKSIDTKSFSRPVPPNDFCFHTANPECSLCQTEHPRGPFPVAGVPYIDSPAERICSVSDEEQGSVAEETEFESLVTVISGKKAIAQDTDNESNFTCLTQSTDLEKYMDCSIEYSSTDDGASLTKSQMSNQLNVSSRSDDASSETLVNTESELTPCASALPDLNGYVTEDHSCDNEVKRGISSSTLPDVHQRAHSVDSYMKIVKTCARNLFMRKSQSEPSHSDMSKFSNNFLPQTSSHDEETGKPANLKVEVCADAFKTSKGSVHLQVTGTKLSCDNIGDPSKMFKKRRVRKNSYTLDEPSSALIMAHADCNCKDDSETVMSPHSCSSEKMIVPTPNPAFKKEKINIVLPPTPDRDKYFPILTSSASYHENNFESYGNNTESELETPTLDTTESEVHTESNNTSNASNMEDNSKLEEEPSKSIVTESESCTDDTPSDFKRDADDNEVNLEQVEIALEEEKKNTVATTEVEAEEPNEQNIVMSSSGQSSLKGDDLQAYLNGIILEIQENQQTRVQRLLDEQNKQWLQLQEEFKEQEKFLCEKLCLVGISSASDNVLENKPPSVSGGKSKRNANESMPSDFRMCPNMKDLHNLNIGNINHKESLTTIGNYSDIFEMNLQKVPENKVSNEEKAFINENLLSTSTQHSNMYRDSVAISNKNMSVTSQPSGSANNSDFSHSFSGNSLESSYIFHSSASSRPTSNLDYPKSHSSSNISRCSSVQSESIATVIPCSRSLFKMDNTHCNATLAASYGPTISTSYSFTNNPSENIQQNPVYGKLRPKLSYDTECLLKDRICDAPMLGGAYSSTAIPPSSSLAAPVYSCSDSDKTNIANFYTIPDSLKQNSTYEISPPTYQPFLHYNNRTTKEKEKYSQHLSSCQHVSGRESFDESSVFTSLGSYTSMALPIVNNSAVVNHLENNLTCDQNDAFKEPATNFRSSHFSDTSNVNSREEVKIESYAAVQQRHPGQNDVLENASPENKIPDQNHQNFVLDSNVHCHPNVSRKLFSKHPLKSQSDSSISQNLHKMPANQVPTTTQAKAQKQIISSSLTNLKRKQSKEFIRDPNLLKKFEKLPALVKGYLTRRLFKTERVQGLIKTLQDTALLIGKLGEELTLKGDAVSEHDVDFHRQLIVQLMTTFHNVYDIFCTISVKERMKIISESRSLERKKKAAEKSKESPVPIVAEKTSASPPQRRSKLSTATLKALERKRRSTIDNRTYTVEDLKGCRARIHSSTSSKSHSSSPSRIYKSSIGHALKRKTTNVRKTQHWK